MTDSAVTDQSTVGSNPHATPDIGKVVPVPNTLLAAWDHHGRIRDPRGLAWPERKLGPPVRRGSPVPLLAQQALIDALVRLDERAQEIGDIPRPRLRRAYVPAKALEPMRVEWINKVQSGIFPDTFWPPLNESAAQWGAEVQLDIAGMFGANTLATAEQRRMDRDLGYFWRIAMGYGFNPPQAQMRVGAPGIDLLVHIGALREVAWTPRHKLPGYLQPPAVRSDLLDDPSPVAVDEIVVPHLGPGYFHRVGCVLAGTYVEQREDRDGTQMTRLLQAWCAVKGHPVAITGKRDKNTLAALAALCEDPKRSTAELVCEISGVEPTPQPELEPGQTAPTVPKRYVERKHCQKVEEAGGIVAYRCMDCRQRQQEAHTADCALGAQ